ncbi:hypothetical protein BCV69DRAFT_280032 [Microstroma glucosiphilum]|uniref:S-adenosyl-L-methionine-dependent methyltransferase n=1 Tax=Pseudomicrostroma glucosiphilum TaxID=1684307 RepID=A0A316UFX2_9BASI|nr:hypothetical protein BCV69DRAFT_280032 [Pseudomicrostroma glucosiphilum]PWN24130.1 hypothetical protein BCV69DRAFT_280032 [Pseudomicrostroma glucosiphilum]
MASPPPTTVSSSSSAALPPSSFLPPLRRQPSSSSLLLALHTLQKYDRALLLLDTYERDLAVGWLNRLVVSDLSWLENGAGSEREGEGTSSGSSSSSSSSSLSAQPSGSITPTFATFEELQRFLVDESAQLLEDITRSEAMDQGRGDGESSGGRGLEDVEPMERVFCFPFDFARPNAVLKVKPAVPNGTSSSTGDRDKERVDGTVALGERRFVVTLIDAPLPPSQAEGSEGAPSDQDGPADSNAPVPASLEASSAVGVQTWAASIVLSDLLVTRPGEIHSLLRESERSRPLRVAELGAGTGLVGIVCAQLLSSLCPPSASISDGAGEEKNTVILTDYHPRVLENLRRNVDANRTGLSSRVELGVNALDWSVYYQPSDGDSATPGLLSSPALLAAGQHPHYDLLLAADVVYAREHASWLYATMSSLLARTKSARAHVLNARRSEGRFGEWGLVQGTDRVFGEVAEELEEEGGGGGEDGSVGRDARLRVIRRVELPKVKGLGRSDERGHIWWTLGWR